MQEGQAYIILSEGPHMPLRKRQRLVHWFPLEGGSLGQQVGVHKGAKAITDSMSHLSSTPETVAMNAAG